jgi:hypothetical protein
VTSSYDFHNALRPEGTPLPEGAEEQVAETRQCARCGGVGTHYLTCPALRLPRGYRVSDPDRRPR